MTLYRAQVVHKSVTGLPRDSYVNVWHVKTASGAPGAGEAEAIAEQVRDFYVTLAEPAAAPRPCDMLGKQVALTGHEVRMYPIVEATGADTRGTGFAPLHIEVFDHLGRAVPGDSLPSEVAMCLSFRNTSLGAIAPARRRGRIYFGPLADDAFTNEDVSGVRRPSDALGSRLRIAGVNLRDALTTAGHSLVIYSRPFAGRFGYVKPNGDPMPDLTARPGATYPVEEFWTDNAFDTMRKRGERSTARVSLTAV